MATIREIRTRVRTVKNIEKITRAMKLVAAARLKRAQNRVLAARPYAERMEAMIRTLAAAAQDVEHPLLQVREERNVAVVVLTADRGLCGSYNTNLLRRAMLLLRPREPQTVRLILVGRKGQGFFRRQPYPIPDRRAMGNEASLVEARALGIILRRMFESKEVDAVYVVYWHFITAGSQQTTVMQLLPLRPPADDAGRATGPARDFIFEPRASGLLEHLLPRYVDTQLYRALVEAIASEHAARMISMSAATENAGTMIDTLTLSMNRARQAAITKEIAEIVTGAEALK
jgi:F-type H+-transporting ATPase subunit gamma